MIIGREVLKKYNIRKAGVNQQASAIEQLRGNAPAIVKVKLYRLE